MRLGVEGGPADGGEVVVEVYDFGRPEGQLEISGAPYVLRMFGAAPHEDAEWHYLLGPPAEITRQSSVEDRVVASTRRNPE